MRAGLAAVLLLFLLVPAAAGASRAARAEDPAYSAANAKLARATPHYPRARLLVEETVWGGVGDLEFEAIERIYAVRRAQTQRAVMRFYDRKLGPRWRRRGFACHVSGTRLVVTLVHPGRRRLGVLIDSRGAALCEDETALLGDLLHVGYEG